MCSENIYIAGRYNKYMRNLSQSPWIDKDDVRIKQSVQELIEDGLKKYVQFDKSVFSSSGREDVDVRMLGNGRPFVFKIVNPWAPDTYNKATMKLIQDYVNEQHGTKIQIRNLQVVTKDCVAKNLKDGEESKTKEYRALCCCSKMLTDQDIERVGKITDLCINQKTPIRVLHRRSLAVRRRTIHQLKIDRVKIGDFDNLIADDLNHVFALSLLTEAGTYIKEFVHGDFGRTEPNLSAIIGDCDTDLIELDVMEVYLDWPPPLSPIGTQENLDVEFTNSDQILDEMASSEKNLPELYSQALKAMQEAESMPRGDARQSTYIKARYLFEQAIELVETLSLFSDNETIEDVTTMDLKYMLIPAYLAKITISAECGPNRLETFSRADSFTKRFFQRVLKYGLGNEAVEQVIKSDELFASSTQSSLETAMQSRTEKIEKYKKMKLLESKLEELEKRVNSGQEVDDEVARKYYLSLLQKWIEETLESYRREIRPALFFERNKSSGPNEDSSLAPGSSSSSTKPKTITIVKDELQKQVFGLGYPSRPTVTVDEFISKKFKDGDLAFQTQKEVYGNSLQRYAEKPDLRREQEENSDAERDEKEDKDDSEELAKKRRWDEFKDDNPRGSGNRHNMG